MNTEACFVFFCKTINLELLYANNQILNAVTWFTHNLLFNTLLQKLSFNAEIRILLINDKIKLEVSDLD